MLQKKVFYYDICRLLLISFTELLDCDPRLLRALHMAQFTTQYLLSSKKLMDEKKKIIKQALYAFDEEEEVLDLKLTKYK